MAETGSSGEPLTQGDRVCKPDDGLVGHVERISGHFAEVRWLTPDNEPSCCVSFLSQEYVTKVPKSVLPQPRNKSWKEESRRFCEFIESVIKEES